MINLIGSFGIVVFGLSMASAAAYWILPSQETWARSGLKTFSVAGLGILVLALGGPVPAVLGLLTCAAGDFFLSRPGERAFLAGVAAFALGHVFYVWMFLGPMQAGMPPLAGQAAIGVITIGALVVLWPRTGDLRWPVAGYVLIISVMGQSALGAPMAGLAVLGAMSFIASDLVLATEKFIVGPSPFLSRLVWGLYWPAQALIAAGALALP